MRGRILSLIYKEFLVLWRDVKARFVLISPPLIQLFVFTFAATLDVQNVSIGILNRDNGEKAIEFVQRFNGSSIFRHITYLKSVEEIKRYIDEQEGIMVVSIDQEFSKNLDSNKNAEVQLILDGRKTNSAQIVAGYASSIATQYAAELAKREGVKVQDIQIFPRYWFNPNLLYYWFTVPGLLGILIMVEAMMLTALSIAREKEMGNFEQLLVSPLTQMEILLGKAIPALLISLLEGTLIIVVGIFIFKIPFMGSLVLLYASMFVFICAILGIGLFLSALCSTQLQSMLSGFIFMSPSVLLSGFATPIENMPLFFQYITYIVPLRYFLVISRGIFLKDLPSDVIWHNMWPMAIIALFTLSGAAFFFRRRVE